MILQGSSYHKYIYPLLYHLLEIPGLHLSCNKIQRYKILQERSVRFQNNIIQEDKLSFMMIQLDNNCLQYKLQYQCLKKILICSIDLQYKSRTCCLSQDQYRILQEDKICNQRRRMRDMSMSSTLLRKILVSLLQQSSRMMCLLKMLLMCRKELFKYTLWLHQLGIDIQLGMLNKLLATFSLDRRRHTLQLKHFMLGSCIPQHMFVKQVFELDLLQDNNNLERMILLES